MVAKGQHAAYAHSNKDIIHLPQKLQNRYQCAGNWRAAGDLGRFLADGLK
jgi:hypothetical protein